MKRDDCMTKYKEEIKDVPLMDLSRTEKIPRVIPREPKPKKNAVCWVCGIDLGTEYGITCKDHRNHPFLSQVRF